MGTKSFVFVVQKWCIKDCQNTTRTLHFFFRGQLMQWRAATAEMCVCHSVMQRESCSVDSTSYLSHTQMIRSKFVMRERYSLVCNQNERVNTVTSTFYATKIIHSGRLSPSFQRQATRQKGVFLTPRWPWAAKPSQCLLSLTSGKESPRSGQSRGPTQSQLLSRRTGKRHHPWAFFYIPRSWRSLGGTERNGFSAVVSQGRSGNLQRFCSLCRSVLVLFHFRFRLCNYYNMYLIEQCWGTVNIQ